MLKGKNTADMTLKIRLTASCVGTFVNQFVSNLVSCYTRLQFDSILNDLDDHALVTGIHES